MSLTALDSSFLKTEYGAESITYYAKLSDAYSLNHRNKCIILILLWIKTLLKENKT